MALISIMCEYSSSRKPMLKLKKEDLKFEQGMEQVQPKLCFHSRERQGLLSEEKPGDSKRSLRKCKKGKERERKKRLRSLREEFEKSLEDADKEIKSERVLLLSGFKNRLKNYTFRDYCQLMGLNHKAEIEDAKRKVALSFMLLVLITMTLL